MADKPKQFISFHTDAQLQLVQLDKVAMDVFLGLCKYADALGCCYPGNDLLGRLTGHRRDSIPSALQSLQAANIIHILETSVPFRQGANRDIQISPYLLRLRQEYLQTALERWENYSVSMSVQEGSEGSGSITFPSSDRQPDQIYNQIHNQIHNQLQQLTPIQSQPSAEGADQPQPPFEEEGQKPGQGQDPNQDTAPTTRREPTSSASAILPSAAANREPPNLLHYKSPLRSLEDEELALEMVNLAPDLSLKNARMLVDKYKWERITRVLQLCRKHSMSIQRPGSWIRAMLRKTDEELYKDQSRK